MTSNQRTSDQFRQAGGGRSNDNAPQNYIAEPTVIPDGNTNSGRAWGLDSYLMHKSQTIFLTGAVTDESCVDIKKRLLYLDKKNAGKDITIYVDSPGGSIDSGISMAAIMDSCKNDIKIIVAGMAASMGSVTALRGTPGKRFALPGSKIMVHSPGYYGGGGPGGDTTEVNIHARVLKNEYKRFTANYTTCMGLDPHNADDLKLVHKLLYRSTYLNATTAAKLGLIDDVIRVSDKAITPAKKLLQDIEFEYDQKELDEIGDDLDEDTMAIVKQVIARRDALINAEIERSPTGDASNPFLKYAVHKEQIARGLIKPDAQVAAEADVLDEDADYTLPPPKTGGTGPNPQRA